MPRSRCEDCTTGYTDHIRSSYSTSTKWAPEHQVVGEFQSWRPSGASEKGTALCPVMTKQELSQGLCKIPAQRCGGAGRGDLGLSCGAACVGLLSRNRVAQTGI